MYQATSANLSAPFLAKVVASACWPDASTFTPKWPVSWMILSRSEFWSRETRIIGGSSDSEENALTVVPCGLRSMCEVTTVTGVGTRASVSRKTVASTRSYPGTPGGPSSSLAVPPSGMTPPRELRGSLDDIRYGQAGLAAARSDHPVLRHNGQRVGGRETIQVMINDVPSRKMTARPIRWRSHRARTGGSSTLVLRLPEEVTFQLRAKLEHSSGGSSPRKK